MWGWWCGLWGRGGDKRWASTVHAQQTVLDALLLVQRVVSVILGHPGEGLTRIDQLGTFMTNREKSMNFVCPMPTPWHHVHQALRAAWERGGCIGTPPPVPLILAGWAYSNDVEKKARWEQTVAWAEKSGLADLIPDFKERERYCVESMTTYDVGPLGGPMYLDWSYEPKEYPGDEVINNAIEILRKNWGEIVGEELGRNTCPLKITGMKGRRLIVQANPNAKPPWGDWNRLEYGDRRRSFTKFRSAINKAVAPVFFDHIDFIFHRHESLLQRL